MDSERSIIHSVHQRPLRSFEREEREKEKEREGESSNTTNLRCDVFSIQHRTQVSRDGFGVNLLHLLIEREEQIRKAKAVITRGDPAAEESLVQVLVRESRVPS